jgi:hypothetical protein
MKTILLTAAVALLVAVAPVRAEDETEMQAAQHDLQSARDHLKAAKHDYEGHRKDALDLVQRALAQVDQGLKIGKGRDTREEKKVNQLEQREKRIENRVQKLDQK